MTQFAVYRNEDPRSRAVYAYLLDIPSDLLGELIDGEVYILVTPQLAGVACSELGIAAGSLADRRDTIIAAMDFLLSGF